MMKSNFTFPMGYHHFEIETYVKLQREKKREVERGYIYA